MFKGLQIKNICVFIHSLEESVEKGGNFFFFFKTCKLSKGKLFKVEHLCIYYSIGLCLISTFIIVLN